MNEEKELINTLKKNIEIVNHYGAKKKCLYGLKK